ncbi:hypothetical protein BCGKFG_BCGKFG_02085, partial [Dysosmobacter welbionis]
EGMRRESAPGNQTAGGALQQIQHLVPVHLGRDLLSPVIERGEPVLHLLVQHGSRQGQHHRSGRHCQHRNDQHHNALSHPITSCFFHYIRLRSPLSSKKAPPKAALFCSAPRRGQAVIPQVLPGAEPHPPPPAPERRATRGGSTALRSCAGRQRNPAPAPAG